MTERTHLPCPDKENCGSSDAYSFNVDKGAGYCHSCGIRTSMYNGKLYAKYGKNSKQVLLEGDEMEDIFEDDAPVENSQKGEYRSTRGITKKTMEFYGVLTYDNVPWNAKDKATRQYVSGTSEEIRFPYPSGQFKLRRLSLDKKHPAHFSVSGGATHEFFGMNLFPAGSSRTVTLTEGEFDAMAAYQMISNNGYSNPVVSLPSATPSGKTWANCKSWLDSFEKIIVSADNDEPGQKVLQELFDLFPNKVYVMNHGEYKDANDFLEAGQAQAYRNAWWSAKKYSPAGFTAAKEDWADVLRKEEPYEYVETPIKAFNEKARGLVKGGITVVKAPPGTGKSSYLRMLQHHLVVEKNCTVAALMMEEQKSTTGRAMATYQLKANVMTKEDSEKNGYTEEQVINALMEVVKDEKFVSFEINPQDAIEDCLQQCKYAVTVYGAEFIFIDHLQRLAYLVGAENATNNLTELGVKLTEFAKRRNVGIICISHVNENGKTKYASAIEEEAIVLIEMERDKMSDNPIERNLTKLGISKNRPFAKTARTGEAGILEYDEDTTMVSEYDPNKDPFDTPVMDKGSVASVNNHNSDNIIPF